MTHDELQSHFSRLQVEFKDFFDKYAPTIVGKTAVSFFKQRFQIEGWERAGDWQQVQRILSYTLHICLVTIVPNGTFDFDYSVAFRFASCIPLLSSTP